MAAPLFWKQPTFFYAFGNTPAYSVAQYLTPEDPAQFLLLGCGDARNVLYTVYSANADSPNATRTFDFTCNDTEPAVLARNAILYSLLHDDPTLENIEHIWSIYYHMKLDDDAVALLYAQCAKLHDASASLEAWTASPYSAFMTFATVHSLNELHRLFGLFLSTKPRLAELSRTFTTAIRSKQEATSRNGLVLTALRAVGPTFLSFDATLAGELHESYWKTGVTTSDSAAVHANPTLAFALSGEPFALHASLVPCVGFHLAEAVAAKPRLGCTANDIHAVCRAQFRAWCAAFAAASAARRVVVRFCVGDAFALCRGLARASSAGLFAAPWGNTPLELLDDCPRRFTAIDTSNLGDALGLVNILLLAAPLLEDIPRAVLYTESLCASMGNAIKSLRTALCGELGAMGLVLGLAPTPYLDGFSSLSQAHQIMFARTQAAEGNAHERLAWRRTPASDALLRFDPTDLAQLLCDIHYELFRSEDAAAIRARMRSSDTSGLQAFMRSVNNIVYVRGTFVALLAQLRRRLHPDTPWEQVMNTVLDRAGADRRLMIGDCSYQDLCLHLQASGLADYVPRYTRVPGRPIDPSIGPLAAWPDEAIGKTLYAALRIPVRAFDKLDGITPSHELFFATRAPSALNYFATFSAFRGTVTQDGMSFEVHTSDAVDVDVIAVALIPAWLVMSDPRSTTLTITVRPGSTTGSMLIEKLGIKMEVFSAGVLDTKSTFYSSDAPLVDGVRLAPLYDSASVATPPSDSPVVTVALDARKANVATLMIRADVDEGEERIQWSNKIDVKAVQVSPTEAEVQTVCGTFKRRLSFPLPVDVKDAKLRIARKSFYVETVVPIAQTVPHPVQSMSTLFHAVCLDRLPSLERSNPEWLDMHMQFSFSDRERANRERYLNTSEPGRIPWVDVKDDIFSLLMRSTGFLSPVRVFGLVDKEGQEAIYAVLFVAAVRLDGAANTVLADAYVLPLADGEEPPSLSIGPLPNPAPMVALWRRLLVGFTERCRTWSHKPSCARPVDKICGCGAGADAAGFRAVKGWMRSGARPEDVTRAAISVPFAPYFVESVGGHMPNFARGMTTGSFASSRISESAPRAHAEPAVEELVGQCAKCGNDARLPCAKCGKVKYCNKNCMRLHAKSHRAACR